MLLHELIVSKLTPLVEAETIIGLCPVNPLINESIEDVFPTVCYQSNILDVNRKANYQVTSYDFNVQFDVYAATYDDVHAIHGAIVAALDGYHDTDTPYVIFKSSIDIPEEIGYHTQFNWDARRNTL